MKLISFIVPCFNSADYMEKCIESLLCFPKRTEIIIVDDGSTDTTPVVADNYALKYPDVVKVIHQENKGHGGAINAALPLAEGLYTRIVDSDDWLNKSALETVLNKLAEAETEGGVDLLITDYTYYRKNKGYEKTISYKPFFPQNVITSWKDVSVWKMLPSHQFMIHALTFRTETIRNSGIVLPEKVYYEDNYILYYLFPFCSRLLYLNTGLYIYLVGRAGQSMSLDVLCRCNSDARTVTEMCWSVNDLDEIKIKNKKLYKILRRELGLLVSSTLLFSRIPRSSEADENVKQFCQRLKDSNKKYYRKFMFGNLFVLLRIPGRFGRFVTNDVIMKIAHSFVGFY